MNRPEVTNGTLSGLDPVYLAAKVKLAAGKTAGRPLAKRRYGRTKERLSIIGFGGIVVKDVTPREAANFVSVFLHTARKRLTQLWIASSSIPSSFR
jgi:hypothetical protein